MGCCCVIRVVLGMNWEWMYEMMEFGVDWGRVGDVECFLVIGDPMSRVQASAPVGLLGWI